MPSIPTEVKEVFFETLWGRMPIADFEKWARVSYNLSESINAEDYRAMMAIDFQTTQGQAELNMLLGKLIDNGEYETYTMLKLLEEAKRNENLPKLLEQFYTLYLFDYNFLDGIVRLRNRLAKDPSENIQPELGRIAQNIIDWIKDGKIVLTGYWDEDARSYSYKDLRTDRDKNPSTGDPGS